MAVSRKKRDFAMSELTLTTRKHVMNDLRPYVCTFLDCSRAGRTYGSLSAFVVHELSAHIAPESSWAERGQGLPNPKKPCIFCEEVPSMADMVDWKESSRHVARHMEEIAFTVVTKPYEDWDFYSDASSVKHQGTHNPRNTNASYDAKVDEDTTHQTRRVQGASCYHCGLCTEKKSFSGVGALQRHMRVVHPDLSGANQA